MQFTKRKIKLFSLTCAISTLCSGFVLGESVQAANNKKWKFENDKWSYVDSNNIRSKSWEKIKGDWFYFNSNGEMEIGWKYINKYWYHFRENGVMDIGWKKVNGYWYYFDNNGCMMTGWQKIGDDWYYLRENGVMDNGWIKVGGYWYYLNENGTMNTGWKNIDGSWYYFRSNGTMRIGWEKFPEGWYYFGEKGSMLHDTYIEGWRIDNRGIAYYEKGFRNSKLQNCKQLIVATTTSMNSSYCNIKVYEKNDGGKWSELYCTNGRVGLNGLSYIENRLQSTNTTPAGVMNIIGGFGVNSNPETKLNYTELKNNMYWDLNNGSKNYNRMASYNPGGDCEHLIYYKKQYEYSLITDYNYNQVSNKGGAIFVHCLGKGATGGCVSMPREKLVEILKWIDPEKNPKILVIPQYDMDNYWY
ncbi:L,D-transpeptidase family protein [Clostridium perfringens]